MLWCCIGFVQFLPFLWLLSIPIYGSFYGVDVVIRFYIWLTIICSISSIVPQKLKFLTSYLQSIIFLIFLSLPFSITPDPVVWLYDKLLWLSEPLWLAVEACGVVLLFMRLSLAISNRIEEDQNLYKVLILGLSGLCYGALPFVFRSLYLNPYFYWYVGMVALIATLSHIAMWVSEDGILSDAAFITLASAVLICIKQEEENLALHPLEIPESWTMFSNGFSYLSIFKAAVTGSLGNTSKAIMFLKKLISPVYLIMTTLRVCSVISLPSVLEGVLQEELADKDNTSVEDERGGIGAQFGMSELMFKLIVITVYTQSIVHHIYNFSTHEDKTSVVMFSWLWNLVSGRLSQVLILVGSYFLVLYNSSRE